MEKKMMIDTVRSIFLARHINAQEIADVLGVTKWVAQDRLRNPERFDAEELALLTKHTALTAGDVAQIVSAVAEAR